MKPESSDIPEVETLIKSFVASRKEKFVSRRHIAFPRELFIELKLSKKQVAQVKRWEKDGHTVWFPMWFCSLERVLFIPEDLWAEYCRKKEKP